MTTHTILAGLQNAGVTLELDGDGLIIDADENVVDFQVRAGCGRCGLHSDDHEAAVRVPQCPAEFDLGDHFLVHGGPGGAR